MGTHKKITINAASSVIQVLFTAILYFLLYKYLLDKLGIKLLGVWSLILSFSSIANLANIGITSGLVKFVAESIVEKDNSKLGKLIFTSLISIVIFFGLISIIVFFSANFFLKFVIEKDFLNVALKILPFSLATLCINAIGGIFTSVLEGHQKNYLRNFIYIISGVILIVTTLILTPTFNIVGVAIAQLIQAFCVLILSIILTLKINRNSYFSFWKWSKDSFKELFSYGYKFQIVSISQLLYEPTTKVFLSKYGGLGLLGNYEMATRLVNQVRALIVNANQVVIPIIAEKSKNNLENDLVDFFKKMNKILLFIVLPLFSIVIAFTPLISLIWIGKIETNFLFSVYILSIASIVNIMCGPSYFSCLGEGKLDILVIAHVTMAILNIVLSFVFGLVFNGYGIILGWGTTLFLGSLYLIIAYSRKLNINYWKIFDKNDIVLIFASGFISLVSIILFSNYINFIGINFKIITISLLILCCFPLILKNETFRYILSILKNKQHEN